MLQCAMLRNQICTTDIFVLTAPHSSHASIFGIFPKECSSCSTTRVCNFQVSPSSQSALSGRHAAEHLRSRPFRSRTRQRNLIFVYRSKVLQPPAATGPAAPGIGIISMLETQSSSGHLQSLRLSQCRLAVRSTSCTQVRSGRRHSLTSRGMHVTGAKRRLRSIVQILEAECQDSYVSLNEQLQDYFQGFLS